MAEKSAPLLSKESTAVAVLAVFATAWYLLMSYWSDGLYGHDEVNHYLRALAFWNDPGSILSYWQRPGFKILYVVPALGGIKFVHIVTILITTSTAIVAWRIALEMRLQNAYLTVLFCAFQPLLLQLSFRMHAEMVAGLLLSLVILTYLKKRWLVSAFLTGYLFTVRQEFALLVVVMGFLLISRRDYRSILMLAACPMLIAVLGWVKSGNPMWILEDFLPVTAYDVVKPGFWHYWGSFAIIFGAPVTAFFILGFLEPTIGGRHWRLSLRRHGFLYVIFFAFFLLQCLLVAEFATSPSPGHFRYLVYLAPIVALIANIGFNTIWRMKHVTGAILLLTLLWSVLAWFTTYHHNYYNYYHLRDILPLSVFVAFGVALLIALATRWRTRSFLALLTALLFVHTFVTERPIAPDSEMEAVAQCAKWVQQNDLANRPILTNHVLFAYMMGPEAGSKIRLPSLFLSTINEASPGTLVIWDSHYGSHDAHGTDVTEAEIKRRKDLRLLSSFSGPEFNVTAFEKVETGI